MGLSRGVALDTTHYGLTREDIPPLPDVVGENARAGWLDPRAWFAHPERRFEMEIGSGKGTFLVQHAPEHPMTNFLGIEYAHEFWEYAADRVRRHALENVRMLFTDAAEFVRWRVPDGIVDVVHVYFPDPWPKSRHHKRRMISDSFLQQAARVLKMGGELRVVTDHAEYWAWMEEHFARWAGGIHHGAAETRSVFVREVFEGKGDGEVVGTNFERKYRREGRPFYAAVLRRV